MSVILLRWGIPGLSRMWRFTRLRAQGGESVEQRCAEVVSLLRIPINNINDGKVPRRPIYREVERDVHNGDQRGTTMRMLTVPS